MRRKALFLVLSSFILAGGIFLISISGRVVGSSIVPFKDISCLKLNKDSYISPPVSNDLLLQHVYYSTAGYGSGKMISVPKLSDSELSNLFSQIIPFLIPPKGTQYKHSKINIYPDLDKPEEIGLFASLSSQEKNNALRLSGITNQAIKSFYSSFYDDYDFRFKKVGRDYTLVNEDNYMSAGYDISVDALRCTESILAKSSAVKEFRKKYKNIDFGPTGTKIINSNNGERLLEVLITNKTLLYRRGCRESYSQKVEINPWTGYINTGGVKEGHICID